MGLFSWGRDRSAQAVPAPEPTDVTRSGSDPTALKNLIIDGLDKLAVQIRAAGRDLPTVVYSKIRSIDDVMRPLMDYIESNNGCSPEQEQFVKRMVTSYIPDSINAFIAVSPKDRQVDSEATKMVVDQFDTMEDRVRQLDHLVRSGAMDALLEQGIFIEMKFGN